MVRSLNMAHPVPLERTLCNQNAPTAIYDLKTGDQGLTASEVAAYRANLPKGYQNIPIVEIRKP